MRGLCSTDSIFCISIGRKCIKNYEQEETISSRKLERLVYGTASLGVYRQALVCSRHSAFEIPGPFLFFLKSTPKKCATRNNFGLHDDNIQVEAIRMLQKLIYLCPLLPP
jgi:hypothetical protein